MPRWLPLGLILFTFAVLASWYATTTPYRQPGHLMNQRGPDGRPAQIPDIGAPDDRQHANYIHHLLNTNSFPVLRPDSPDLGETYQSHQPPLYYLLAATLGDQAHIFDDHCFVDCLGHVVDCQQGHRNCCHRQSGPRFAFYPYPEGFRMPLRPR